MQAQEQPQVQVHGATGRTVIAEAAVAKVAALAARSVDGVYALGTGAARSIGAIRDVVGAADVAAGVRVEVGETQVAVDVNMVARYGKPLQQLANAVRAAVYAAVEELVGMDVIEVNVEINDVHVPSADADRAPARPTLGERIGVLAQGAPARPTVPAPSADSLPATNGEPS
ncbi:Asp23/Gls24 family envelope stress response protein [Pseudarthrobacter sp. P1]|uniref:Asp23/Gls24 family envelope stress response protein n=1 Tax=Pseudarthrobacter sp. P1 TaxID=3418418 RepID=UPI003CFA4382